MEISRRYRKIWKAEEDEELKETANKHSAKNWEKIADEVSQKINKCRTAKQCRERWDNFLKYGTNCCEWTESETKLLFEIQFNFGNKWSKISAFFPGKSKNSIKNFYYSTIRRNFRRFNNGKIEDEQIKGPIDEIMKISEIRQILLSDKSCHKNDFKQRKLSADCLEKTQRLNGSLLAFSPISLSGPENIIEWDNFEENGINDVPDGPEFYIDQTILWD